MVEGTGMVEGERRMKGRSRGKDKGATATRDGEILGEYH